MVHNEVADNANSIIGIILVFFGVNHALVLVMPGVSGAVALLVLFGVSGR